MTWVNYAYSQELPQFTAGKTEVLSSSEVAPVVASGREGGVPPRWFAACVVMLSRSGLWSYPFAVESSQLYDGVAYIFLYIPLAFLAFSQ